ncbi:MAG: hypothetical protein Kow00121_30630 [Elainellaceae cyanobacterium]
MPLNEQKLYDDESTNQNTADSKRPKPASTTKGRNGKSYEQADSIVAAIDINAEARQGGEQAIARKVETLHDAQRRGKALADEEAVTEMVAYVQQSHKRQSQMKQFMQSYRQELNGALGSIAVELPEDDEDFFGSVPEFSLPSGATSFLKGSPLSK